VHVPGLARLPCKAKKQAIGVELSAFAAFVGKPTARSKYQSYWYGNPVALTIYVNANELRFSPISGQPFAPCQHKVRASFHPRG